MSRTTSRYKSGNLFFYDKISSEMILPVTGIFFEDDFLGPGSAAFPTAPTAGTFWGKKLVRTAGNPAVANQVAAPGGAALLSIDATAEKQDAVLYWLDDLGLDVSKGGGFELRFNFPVIPGANTQVVAGLMSSWIDGPDNNAAYLRAGFRANGAPLGETFDGTTRTSLSLGPAIVNANEAHVIHCSFLDTTNVLFSLDGNVMTTPSPQTKFAATSPTSVLQPYVAVYKAAGAGTASLAVDYFRAWGNRS